MAEKINMGVDLHKLVASRLTGKPEDQVEKDERQKAKAVNFGLPGGMGVKALREYARTNYGTELTEHEVTVLYDVWFETFPEMLDFLGKNDSSSNLGIGIANLLSLTGADFVEATGQNFVSELPRPEMLGWMARKVFGEKSPSTKDGRPYGESDCNYFWERLDSISDRLNEKYQKAVRDRAASKVLANAVIQLFEQKAVLTLTCRLRSHATYCARHNTIFQGLAADGAKLAMWKLWRNGYRIVNFIHDEFLIELPEQDDYTEQAEEIKRLMIEGMQEVVPNVCIDVEYAISRHWSKGAEAVYDAEGRLVPYEE